MFLLVLLLLFTYLVFCFSKSKKTKPCHCQYVIGDDSECALCGFPLIIWCFISCPCLCWQKADGGGLGLVPCLLGTPSRSCAALSCRCIGSHLTFSSVSISDTVTASSAILGMVTCDWKVSGSVLRRNSQRIVFSRLGFLCRFLLVFCHVFCSRLLSFVSLRSLFAVHFKLCVN